MRHFRYLLVLLFVTACQAPASLPPRFPAMLPALQAQSQERANDSGKVGLGLRLFFEPRLSANNRMSCASCHQPNKGFSNGEPNALGVTGQRGARNVPSIYGMKGYHSFFWDGRAQTLEEQALGPIQNPIEMNETLDNVVRKLESQPYYHNRFREVFGTGVSAQGIAEALVAFERALTLKPSPYERFMNGEVDALNESQLNGMTLFGRQAHCATCHSGLQFTDNKFHNLGVGYDRPNPDPGRFAVTQDPQDRGAFRTASLHQLSRTGPYMHDGSLRSLEEVIDYYDRGGIANPNLSLEMGPLNLLPEEKADLLAFLHALESPGDNLQELAHLPGVTQPGEAPPAFLQTLGVPF